MVQCWLVSHDIDYDLSNKYTVGDWSAYSIGQHKITFPIGHGVVNWIYILWTPVGNSQIRL